MTRKAWFRLLFLIMLLSVLALFALPAPAQQTGTTCIAYHTVRYGENLFRISLNYGVSMNLVAAVNGITNPARIFAGDTLCIPASGATNFVIQPTGATTASVTVGFGNTGSTLTTSTTSNNEAVTENWCYPGQPWGDGRCNVTDTALRNYMWECGWYNAHNIPTLQCGTLQVDTTQVYRAGCDIVVTAPILADVTDAIEQLTAEILADGSCATQDPLIVHHNPPYPTATP
ncbi:MAG: LysM peptidoglycan-binding domain-containing protein [Chloroflexi bacterium]|nr:MAG: LysM peptidoglycan-binding domain-containing protein [Chloroflexota bacterium]